MAGQIKDVRLEVKARNNLILTKMEAKGIFSVKELCRKMGKPGMYAAVVSLISMKISARGRRDQWRPIVHTLAEFFQCMPEDLFSEPQQYNSLETNRANAELAFTEIQQMTARNVTPEIELQALQLRKAISEALEKLTPREAQVIRMRFGFDGEEKTLEQVGEIIGVCGARAREIEAAALRKLKHPARLDPVILAGGRKRTVVRRSSWSNSNYIETIHELDDEVLKAL